MSGERISVIIPSRGLTALLRVCIERAGLALSALPEAGHRIVVVDNASDVPYQEADMQDLCGASGIDLGAGSGVDSAVEIEFMRFDTHHSFSACVNRAAARSPGAHFLLLNNDVLLHANALVEMTEALHDERVAVCGARMVFPDDTIQHCGVVFGAGDVGPFHDFRRTPTRHVPRATRSLQAVTGACMLIRGSCFTALDGFDESYPFGLEDIDFCLRARQRGWSVVCTQRYDSLHFESMTEGRVALDVGSRRHFMEIWKGRYGIDAPLQPGDPR